MWDLDAPELQCVFAAAEELGAAVFVHPWDMDQGSRMKKYWMPWLVGECASLESLSNGSTLGVSRYAE